jgi:hypothetical protein
MDPSEIKNQHSAIFDQMASRALQDGLMIFAF